MVRHSILWYAARSAGMLVGIFTGPVGYVFLSALVAHLKKRRDFQNQRGTLKKPLSQRWHICCGIEMQRDLYSAFLTKCVVNNSLDIARAKQLWPGLEPVLSEAVSRAYQSASGGTVPASFGFGNQRQSRSLVKPEETITEDADAVLRDTIYEEESRREVV